MTRSAWDEALEEYYTEHETVGLDADARSPKLLSITPASVAPEDPTDAPERVWEVRQTLADPEGHHDWVIDAVVHLDASDEIGEMVLTSTRMHRL